MNNLSQINQQAISPKTEKSIKELEWIEKLTHYMDNLVRVPGTKFRFGIDPLLGLIPFAGEFVSFIISAIILLALIRHGTSGKLAVLMLSNIAIDSLLGAVPFLGDIFDFVFKANKKNVDLLKQYHHEEKHKGSGIKIILAVLAGLLIIFFILIYVSYLFLKWSSNYIQPKLFCDNLNRLRSKPDSNIYSYAVRLTFVHQ